MTTYDRYGGALYVGNAGDVSLDNSYFCGNSVSQTQSYDAYGGALYAQTLDSLSISNVVIQENSASSANSAATVDGAALALSGVSGLLMRNNTVVGNSSATSTSWFSTSSGIVENTIFAYETGDVAEAADNGTNQAMSFQYNDWYQNSGNNAAGSFAFSTSSNGNLTSQPQFLALTLDGDCDNDNLALDPSSALVDAGNPAVFDGDGSRSDIGAYAGPGLIDNDSDGFSGMIDCDDSDALTHPGAASSESLTDCMRDADGDGFGDNAPSNPAVVAGQDCDDTDILVYPGANEFCNGQDEDCDGVADDNPINGTTWYLDADNDGYGGSSTLVACSQPTGHLQSAGDCDDLNPSLILGLRSWSSTTQFVWRTMTKMAMVHQLQAPLQSLAPIVTTATLWSLQTVKRSLQMVLTATAMRARFAMLMATAMVLEEPPPPLPPF